MFQRFFTKLRTLRALAAAFAAVTLLAGRASAQEPSPAQSMRAMGWEFNELDASNWSATPRDRARALTRNLRDIFEVESDGSLRHRLSGRACPAELATWRLGRVALVPATPERPARGEDVQCTYLSAPSSQNFVSAHISTSIFPHATQSLIFTATGFAQFAASWRAWPVNMAPNFAPAANIAMTRGAYWTDAGDLQVSDMWITAQHIDARFWEFKFRAYGAVSLRPQMDALVYEGLQRIAGIAPTIDPNARTAPLMDEALLRWSDGQSPETSALQHVPSGLVCPPPPAGTVRSSLSMQGTDRLSCRYSGPNSTWAVIIIRRAQPTTAVEALRAFGAGQQRIAWDNFGPFMLEGFDAAYGDGRASMAGAPDQQTRQLVAASENWSVIVHVYAAAAAASPSRQDFVAFAIQAARP